MKNNRGFIQILGPIIALIAILAGGYIYYQQNYAKITPTPAPVVETPNEDKPTNLEASLPSSKPIACTQEAKICPDGSSVGRTGPKCEFAACPAEKTTTTVVTAYIKSINGNQITLDYIEILYGDEAKKALVADGKCTLDEITNNRCDYL